MPMARAADGAELSYRTAGVAPPSVLFMHGWAGSGAYFGTLLEHLDLTRLQAVTYDFRGHGNSTPSEGGYSLDDIAADAIAVADAAGADTFVLVGFSMSGKFAQYVTCVHPRRVLGQVLLAGCPVGELPLPPELVADWYGRAGNAEGMVALVQAFSTQPLAQHVLEQFGRDAARVSVAALRGTMETVTATSFADRLADARVPTLVVGGTGDAMFAPDALREGVVAPVPGARLELLDCGHEVPLERPRELAVVIESFLAGLP